MPSKSVSIFSDGKALRRRECSGMLRVMGDKSPKSTQKQASQKQAKANSAKQQKSAATAAKAVAKPGKK